MIDVYVPKEGTSLERLVKRGSGIVGENFIGDETLVYYEGNIYGASNIRSYEDCLEVAAGRMIEKYPTVARMIVRGEDLILAGVWDPETKVLYVHEKEVIDAWTKGIWVSPSRSTER